MCKDNSRLEEGEVIPITLSNFCTDIQELLIRGIILKKQNIAWSFVTSSSELQELTEHLQIELFKKRENSRQN